MPDRQDAQLVVLRDQGFEPAVQAFFAHVKGYRGRPEYARDPYTDDHTFLPLFKVFHACANQLGLRISNEALVYRFLLEAARASVEAAS